MKQLTSQTIKYLDDIIEQFESHKREGKQMAIFKYYPLRAEYCNKIINLRKEAYSIDMKYLSYFDKLRHSELKSTDEDWKY